MRHDEVLAAIEEWSHRDDRIRVVILTSSRAKPGDHADRFSDYDIILVVGDVETFGSDDAWQYGLGRPLVRWGDEDEMHGEITYFRGVIYDNFVKIDYTIWSEELLRQVVEQVTPLAEFDAGYRVLVDKDGATARLAEATFRAYVPARPSEPEYRALIDEFWWDTTYAAHSLRRDDLVFAKSFMLEHEIRIEVLAPLLGWRIELEHDWSLPIPLFGRGLKQLLPSAVWSELESSYVGPSIDDNWDALFQLVVLFRRVAKEVGDALGYEYPEHLDDLMSGYLTEVRSLAR